MPPLPLHRIPVQTGANCGLFAIVAAARFLGCDSAGEDALNAELDRLEKADLRTFIGEVLSVDLLLDLIQGVTADGSPLFTACSLAFSSSAELSAIIQEASRTDAALIIPFARPQSYDAYYRLLGQQVKGTATDAEVAVACRVKEGEENFQAADAHWALINRVDEETGGVVLADSFEDVWGGGHGYEAEFSVEKLAAANIALDGCFDWNNFLDAQGRAWGVRDVCGRAYTPSAPRAKNPERLAAVLCDDGLERLDLAGRLVLMQKEW